MIPTMRVPLHSCALGNLESCQPFALVNTIIEQHERDLHSLFGRIHTALGAITPVFMRYWTEEIRVSGRRLQQVGHQDDIGCAMTPSHKH